MTPMPSFRALPHLLCLLCLTPVSCATAELQASSGHVPVLLGPVSCIGCTPDAARPAEARPFDAEAASVVTGFATGQSSSASISSGPVGSVGELADSSAGDRCAGEIRLDAIKASAFFIETFVYSRASSYVGASGHVVTVPGGVCDPRAYPDVPGPSERESP